MPSSVLCTNMKGPLCAYSCNLSRWTGGKAVREVDFLSFLHTAMATTAKEGELEVSPGLYGNSESLEEGVRTDRDLFRKKERRVKALVKEAEESLLTASQRKKRHRQQATPNKSSEGPLPWSEVIDLHYPLDGASSQLLERYRSSRCLSAVEHCCECPGAEIYEFAGSSGFYVIKNALCVPQQLYWAKIAVEEYSLAEHTNLTNLANLRTAAEESKADMKQSTCESEGDVEEESVWKRSLREKDNFSSFKKLRWSCLGYHYDWTMRSYQRNEKSVMPKAFSTLCSRVAEAAGEHLEPEAAIINYYPLNSTMGGHLDDAEHNLQRPIVSFSLGCSALFLLGGPTKLQDAHVLLLRSGDAVIMAGQSRVCYHGVPCILSAATEKALTGIDRNESERVEDSIFTHSLGQSAEFADVTRYLRENRVNMNARQVRVEHSDDWIDKTGTGCVKV